MGWLDWWTRRGGKEPPALVAWRDAWRRAVEASGDGADRLGAELDALGLPEPDIEIEREMLDGLAALAVLRVAAGRNGLPAIETGHRSVAGDTCHFSAPASMPDEPAQPSGRLLLTDRRAIFAGPGTPPVPWHRVARVITTDRDIVLVERGAERLHRFRCNSFSDALTGAFIARRLAG